jgi:hypothetical protein
MGMEYSSMSRQSLARGGAAQSGDRTFSCQMVIKKIGGAPLGVSILNPIRALKSNDKPPDHAGRRQLTLFLSKTVTLGF